MQSKKINSMLSVMMVTIIIKVFGLIRELVFSFYYGATNISDAYNLSQTIPVTLFSIISLAIGTILIPLINSVKQDNNYFPNFNKEEKVNRFLSNVIYILVIVCSILCVAGSFFSDFFIKLFASNLSFEAFETASSFLRITIFTIYSIALSYIFMSFLRTKKKYFLVALSGIFIPIILTISYVVSQNNKDLEFLLPIGILVSQIAQFLFLIIISIKSGFRFRKYFSIKDSYFRKMLLLSIPIIITTGLDEINVIIDKNIASSFDVGSISLLTYGTIIPSILHTVITTSVNIVFFSEVSSFFSKKDKSIKELDGYIFKAFSYSMMFMIPCVLGILFFKKDIIDLMFKRGAFTEENSIKVSELLVFYSIQLIPNIIRILSLSILNANKKTSNQILIGIFSVSANIGLNYLLSYFMGLNGLALATSLSCLVASVVAFLCAKKYTVGLTYGKYLYKFVFYVAISSVIVIPSYFLHVFLSTVIQNIFSLIFVVLIDAMVYFIIIFIVEKLLSRKKTV